MSLSLLILAQTSEPLSAQGINAKANEESCRGFVQSFYDSYAPGGGVELRPGDLAEQWLGQDHAVRAFDSELARELREVLESRARTGDRLLDFDPILKTQYARDKYVAGSISRKGEHYLVEVYGVSNGRQNDQPDVVPELVFEVGRWTFVNFHYPNRTVPRSDENLLSMLKRIRKALPGNTRAPSPLPQDTNQ